MCSSDLVDIAEQLGLRNPKTLVGSFDRKNLVYRVQQRSGQLDQIRAVIERHAGESGIVYCTTRADTESVCASLNDFGIPALPYHAGMPDVDRHRNQESFIEDRTPIIVATVAFGMGIDKPNVRFVVHAGMPKSLENYQQESGRAGRDGLEAECVLIFSPGDIARWKNMIAEADPAVMDAQRASLNAVYEFCTLPNCRHRSLVRYFGQDLPSESCNACDVCLGDVNLVDDALIIGQKILSSVLRQHQRYGGDYTAQVLAGDPPTILARLEGIDALRRPERARFFARACAHQSAAPASTGSGSRLPDGESAQRHTIRDATCETVDAVEHAFTRLIDAARSVDAGAIAARVQAEGKEGAASRIQRALHEARTRAIAEVITQPDTWPPLARPVPSEPNGDAR